MFSALGNIFSSKPRHAEQSDTRQGIQRHDPEFERRNKKKNKKDDENIDQNGATVSVEALKTFLDNFVKNGAEEQATSESPSNEKNTPQFVAPTHDQKTSASATTTDQTSRKASQAASAYQTTAENEKSSILIETTDQAEGPTLDLSAADIRVIYTLIGDLKILNNANIEYLRIERAETFLDSLTNAVKKAKKTIG